MFLGRSKADKPIKQQLINRLTTTGATVQVVRGDVCKAADIMVAISAYVATGRKIGGILQAVIRLYEALFTQNMNEV